ncbi:MAG: carbon-nitrogen hydrolase family protein [Chloroflexota bacterium]|nr:MAG: carbon-nitrogen hydrolase family protein [Chloroflexota bacterium]
MTKQPAPVRVAVIQAASVLFDRQATLEKACQLIRDAGKNGAQLVLFPEALIPGYPRGLSFGMVVGSRTQEGREIWRQYWENAVDIPSSATDALGEAASEAGVYSAIGVIERDSQGGKGTLYCTLLYFSQQGKIIGKHRKLKPTGSERLIWGEGDGSTLPVFPTEIGNIGGLICWENYMPLARMAMYSKGVELYLAPTADQRDTWQATMRHIACEGRCFVLGCNQFVTKDMYPQSFQDHPELDGQPEVMCRGGSVIISPLGEVLAGPLYDQEGILYADLDMNEIARAKLDFDVVGHYARPDVFQLNINEHPMPSVKWTSLEGENLP